MLEDILKTEDSQKEELLVEFEYQGIHFAIPVEEARRFINLIQSAMDKAKVKCPTCRCRIYPGSECVCCKNMPPASIDEDNF